jgi:phosphoglycolate phosphatase
VKSTQKDRAILFDLDGTLIDSTEAILESFEKAYGHFGKARPEEEIITEQIGHPLDGMFLSMGVAVEEVDAYVTAYKAHYRTISREKTTLLPGAMEAVEQASTIARLGVVTTKTAKYSIELLEHLGLMHYFEVMIGREDVIHPKPHPEPIEKALSQLKIDRSKSWMIGDTCMDMHAARAAGIGGLAVSSGYGSEASLQGWADSVTKSALDAVASLTQG